MAVAAVPSDPQPVPTSTARATSDTIVTIRRTPVERSADTRPVPEVWTCDACPRPCANYAD